MDSRAEKKRRREGEEEKINRKTVIAETNISASFRYSQVVMMSCCFVVIVVVDIVDRRESRNRCRLSACHYIHYILKCYHESICDGLF